MSMMRITLVRIFKYEDIHLDYVELRPAGLLTRRMTDWLTVQVTILLATGWPIIIISGTRMRYQSAEGMAFLSQLLADIRDRFPAARILLTHLPPDLRAAANLAGLLASWPLLPEQLGRDDTPSVAVALNALRRQ
jgi:predicted TIM-barrel fold metal-dependent hydrolase